LLKAGQHAPAATQINCNISDASFWTGVVDTVIGAGIGKMIAGKSKGANAKANPKLQTIYDVGSGKSTYQVKRKFWIYLT
tara:strand:- start:926 stop:1165 length:240 start_codon:yes stop_codon:yes gene_type:complete